MNNVDLPLVHVLREAEKQGISSTPEPGGLRHLYRRTS